MKIAALVSGGKDSLYSLYKSIKEGNKPVCLVTIASENKESYMFHTPAIELVKLQAKAMNIPLIYKKTKGEKEVELKDLKLALQEAKKKYKIEGVVSGALYSKYQKQRIDYICDELGLESITPLWHIDSEKYMNDLLANRFKVIITAVAAEGLDENWLGKEITMQRLIELKKLAKKYHFNLSGEGGEYETATLNSPLFNKQINILEMKNEGNHVNIIKAKLVSKENV